MYKDPIFAASHTQGAPNPALLELGFRFGDKGTHTSRTIMLSELSSLLGHCAPKSSRADYMRALVDENCLGKHTLSTRRLTLQRMSELYALDPTIPIFRLLRFFWAADEKAHAQLALLASLARDPLLRATAPVISSMMPGEELARQKFTDVIKQAVEGRLNDNILDKVVRNTASSWTQSGHLEGRSRKKRITVRPTPASAAFAFLLSYMLGQRARDLFNTIFARVLDRDSESLIFLAMDANRLGFLNIKHAGGVIVISFDEILNDQEKRLLYGKT